MRALLPEPPGRGLEVGVGSGKFAAPLGITTGLEPSAVMAERARRLGIEVVTGVGEALPFPEASFDLVLMVTTLCFLDSPPQCLREIRRVLAPGGCLLIGFVDKNSTLGHRYRMRQSSSRFYGVAEFFTAAEVVALLEQAGFTVAGAKQALLEDRPPGCIRDGYGDGAFVVIKGEKGPPSSRREQPRRRHGMRTFSP